MNQQLPKNPPVKYNKGLITVIILLLIIILLLLFKSPLPAPPGPPPPPPLGREPGPGGEKLKSEEGLVTAYKYNVHLDINSIQLKTPESGTITIDFRPHTAKTVMGIGGLGQMVTVKFVTHPDNESVGYILKVIKNVKTGISANMDDLPPPPDVAGQSTENFNLLNPMVITDTYGGIVALRKDNLLFHFKPGLVDDISALIKSSHQFTLQAVRRDDNLGFVNIKHDKIYIVLSITIDNKTFLVR